jgi:CMP-N,N'-diacetyllegionaminic acid synthase
VTERLLGLVVARAGSKRLPGKNARSLAGNSLIERSLLAARAATVLDGVGFSTDSEDFLALARKAGHEEDYRRPAALASDEAGSADVVIDYVDWRTSRGDPFTHVVLLQPTSPFRDATMIDLAVMEWRKSGGDSLVSVGRLVPHAGYCVTRNSEGRLLQGDSGTDLLLLDGAIYIAPVTMIREKRTFWHSESTLFITDYPRWFDIDTEADFSAAERLLK